MDVYLLPVGILPLNVSVSATCPGDQIVQDLPTNNARCKYLIKFALHGMVLLKVDRGKMG